MSDRTLRQLVGALALAVAIWVVSIVLSGASGGGGIGASGEIASVFDDVDGPSLTGMVISGPDGTVRLSSEGEAWTVNGFRADPRAITTLRSAVTAATVGELVAANPDNHGRMGVDEASALRVTFSTDAAERSILVGRSGRRFQTSYVRAPGADGVYLLEGRLGSEVRKDVDAWRDKSMFAVDTAAVARISVSGDRAYTLVRGDSAWVFENGAGAEASLVRGMLAELAGFAATGFYAETDSVSALPPEYTARALDASGATLIEITVGRGEADRWARISSDDYLYRVSAFRAERLAPDEEMLLGQIER